MTRPQDVIEGRSHLLTRRCTQRQFLLAPSERLNHLFLFCVAYAAELYSVGVHAACVMSNHYHLAVTDPFAQLPKFTHRLNLLLSRALNAHYGRWENLFVDNSSPPVWLVDCDDAFEKMVYVLTNPVAAGLVPSGAHWPGVLTTPAQIGQRQTIQRPDFFFRKNGPVPESVTLELTRPPFFSEETDEEFARRLGEAVEAREESIRARFREEKRKFQGTRKIRAQSHLDAPRTREPRRNLNPRVACRDKWKRIAALQANQQFLKDYRAALKEFCERVKRKSRDALEVIFPRGTYWMRVHHGVRCEASPPPAPS